MTIKLIEEAVVQLHAYLSANIAAKVADLRTRYTDTALPDIKAWYLGNIPASAPEYPSVVIHAADWQPGVLQKPTNMDVINTLNLIVFYADPDFELRFRRLSRYCVGLLELCNAGQHTYGYVFKVTGAVTFWDTMKPAPYLQGVTIPITLSKGETY